MWKYFHKQLRYVINICFKLLGKDLTDEAFLMIEQFVKFGIVGLSNTVLSYAIYVSGLIILKKMNFSSEYDYLLAQVLAFILSVLWSFYWNNKMVFVLGEGKRRSTCKTLVKTFVSYSFTGLFLNSVLLVLWVKVLGISELIAPIINLMISVPLNFLINKFWAFKQS